MSASHVVAEPKVYVTSTPGVSGGKPCIAGTRISVQLVVLRTEAGETPDDIVRAYPHLSLAEVHGALAYYFDHVQEINESIERSRKVVDETRRMTGPGPYESTMLSGGTGGA
jgi:uncharacterized protein (DUF433 family)